MKRNVLKENLFFSLTWDFLNVYLPSQNQRSDKTVKAYCDALTIFRRYISDECNISIEEFEFKQLTYDFVLDYRIYLENKGYKPKTVNHRISAIAAYMKYASLRKSELFQIYMNVSEVPYVKETIEIKEIIENTDALKKLLSAPKPSKIGIRDQIIMTILYDAAIRADELINLDLSDVNIYCDTPYLRIFGKGSKERIVPVTENTVLLIKNYINLYHKTGKSSPFIYTIINGHKNRMSERNIERIIAKYGEIVRKENPDIPEKIHPHMLRRTRATGWYRDGVPIETIAVLLGHSDVQTTRNSYAKPSVEMLRNEIQKSDTAFISSLADKPLWENDDDLAVICGLR